MKPILPCHRDLLFSLEFLYHIAIASYRISLNLISDVSIGKVGIFDWMTRLCVGRGLI